jgi:hypothetical protein
MARPEDAAFRTAQIGHVLDSLSARGIDSTPLVEAMAGDVNSIDQLSRNLLPHVRDYRSAKANRERSRTSKRTSDAVSSGSIPSRGLVRDEKHIPRSDVDFLIALMVDACARAKVSPPTGLAELVRVHLGADEFGAQESKAPGALDKAAQYKLAYPDASQGEIARHAGVTRPSVSQWIKEGHLDRAVDRLRRLRGAAELIRSTIPRA